MPRYPRSGEIFTTAQVYDLPLDDSPALICKDGSGLQDSHVTVEQLLSVPGLADLRWRYVRTTHEWISVFSLCPGQEDALAACVDVEPYIGMFSAFAPGEGWWITPKGFPREQQVLEI